MTEKTHWKRLQNPDYIGAYWLDPGQDKTVQIDYVVREQITGAGGKKDECTVAHLLNEKPFILNATNCKTIAKMYGNFIEDWAGQPITVYATTTKMAGEVVECLRIRPSIPKPMRQSITDARLEKAIEAIAAGKYTKEELLGKFELTEQQSKRFTDWEQA